MTDLSPLLAEARRIAEEVRRYDNWASEDAGDYAARISALAAAAPRLAAALLALIPVVEAARELIEAFALGPLDVAAKYGPDVDGRELEDEALRSLSEALSPLPTTLTEALKP